MQKHMYYILATADDAAVDGILMVVIDAPKSVLFNVSQPTGITKGRRECE